MALAVKNLPASIGDTGDMGSIPESERFLGVENGNLLQYSCLEDSMDRGIWQATVHQAAKSWTQLSTHASCPDSLLPTYSARELSLPHPTRGKRKEAFLPPKQGDLIP